MNKLKSALTRVKKSPIVKAVVIWVVALVVLAFVVDKLLMPLFAGEFAKTGPVPNLEGMSQEAAEAALTEAGF